VRPLLPYLRRYLWIDGRSGRREWWTIMVLCVVLGIQLDAMSVFALPLYGKNYGIDGVVRIALSVLLFWIDFASTIRRVHDRGKSGWSALPFAFPGLGWMWMVIECGMLPSQKGRNRYGPTPGSAEEARERPALPEILASFGAQGARGPWSAPASRPAAVRTKPTPATLKHVRFQPAPPSTRPAMARERTRTARQPVMRTSAVTRVADSNQTRGKTILIVLAATILGLAVAIYMADNIVVHQSEKLTTTP
jgi:uncharacterized membrane protein YhaH (DUF805 family)